MSEKREDIPEMFELKFVGQRMQHSFYVYHIISCLLGDGNAKNIKGIIELGTGSGALTTYLGLWGARMGVPVYSFDFIDHAHKGGSGPIFQRLGITYRQEDIFKNEESIKNLMAFLNPVYLVCDNGNKVKEFNLFAPFLASGSIISVHDWSTKIRIEDIAETIMLCGLQPLNQDQWLSYRALFASWIKR